MDNCNLLVARSNRPGDGSRDVQLASRLARPSGQPRGCTPSFELMVLEPLQ